MNTTKRAKLIALAAIALFGASCGGPSTPPPAPTAAPRQPVVPAPPAGDPHAFRKNAPAPAPEKPFVPPNIVEARLKNGIRVLLVERREMPIVALQLVADRGADQTRAGLASLAASLFTSGTQSRTAIDISDGFLALGARYGSSANYDGTFVSLQVLSNRLTPALELFADVVQNPSFPPAEVRRELPRRLNAIAQQRDNPSVVLGNLVAETLYGPAHAYGVSLLGTEATMKHARPDELRTFHRAQIRPDRATLVAAGDVSRQALLAALETTFAGWKGAAAKPRPLLEPAPRAGGGRIVLIDRPGATQSHVALADVGVPRKTPDYAALVVLNTILGGQFSSRLNLNLRETHAYTYGAGSAFDMRRGAGPFRTFGAILRESTGPAVTEMWRELERMRNEPVSAEELAAAQAYLVGRLPARFETAASTADALGALAVHDLPLDEYATYPARIARVTAADVQRAAQTYLRPERLRIVVLGDAASVRAPLEALKLGPVELRPES